jgi:pyruvate/2-oxoglutarate dehydrogenase complex dihydrolipoamide acyltransferase (E2) component
MVEIILPQMGFAMENGMVLKWLKQEGEKVKKDETVCEITSEKITATIESPVDGVLRKILVREDEEVPVSTVLAQIEEED